MITTGSALQAHRCGDGEPTMHATRYIAAYLWAISRRHRRFAA